MATRERGGRGKVVVKEEEEEEEEKKKKKMKNQWRGQVERNVWR